ncbi:uncharacterized protein BJ171DRAFT_498696 [Polychytrium aggregatum]|uniref:uncharacterized protein n=1 Tax=Polychytrium aggregatum TaxID=110093 RepID=UPI0022FEB6CA|nr:uncharacterized protein BJ171DRAFT_498696 [Polychytrium aggregatum]KAI9206108.1 hypothetical protein BJ171DRAFT_498696 [Polychytrium aggregatum]
MSNAVDIGIHLVTIIIVLQSVWLQQSVPPLLMSIVLVLYATRVMLHLRIIPSVGPLVRIWVSASVNILPILIPMAVVITSFAGGFYIVERGLSNTGIPPSVHFSDAATTFQSVMTMASWDYSVLENSSNPQVFTLRMMFHVVFIIFLINVIIALMTVNVADIHANTTAAWLMEISDLMVELDLLWPFPVRYELRSESDRYMDEKLESQSRRPSEVSNFVFNSNSKPTFLGRLLELWAKVSGSLRKSHELMAKDDPQTKSVLLYTWPAEEVRKTQWWEADIADGDRKRQKSNSTQPAGGAGPNWTSTIASVLGVQDRQQARTLPGGGRASIVKLGEKSALPRCDEDEEASEAINLGFITNEELATSSESLRAPLLHNAKSTNFSRTGTVDSAPTNQGSGFPAAPVVPAVTFGTTQPPPQRMGRRMSRAALDPGIIDERHISIMSSMTNQNDFRELDANVDKLKKEFGSQLSDIKSLISELDKQFKSEARTQKENVKIMNELLEFERKDRGMALSKIEEDVQKMTSIILSAKEDEVNSGKLFKVFGKRGSTKTPADSTGYPS